jgi:gamma-glutamylcyclotransferase (GGCT)/AIG2-like uncharacterized protein YtfP
MGKIGRHLFVYGTLQQSALGALGKAQRERLARESGSLGAATMAGARLYDLGRYPGLVESDAAGDVVHGEVVELANPDRTLLWLDAYEGIVPGIHDQNEYARIERRVRLADGTELQAWVYVFLKDVACRRVIASGRW